MATFRDFLRRLGRRKNIDALVQQSATSEMKKILGPVDLVFIGIGCIIGTGIFVLTGVAAKQNAGPGIVLSFIIAAVVSALSAFSYSELACMVPISGSAYSYAVATMGELMGWIVGWDLLLEYLVGASTVAVGWSSYMVAFFKDVFDVTLDTKTTESPIVYSNGNFSIQKDAYINIPAILSVVVITAVLLLGIRESAMVNNVLVVVKVVIILIFIFGAARFVDTKNYKPFVPARVEGKYGVSGVIKGAQRVFFAYIGFDAVSTAAQEAKNPQRDMPIGILVSLFVCTVLYIAVSVVLTGIVPYYAIDEKAPIANALLGFSGTKWMRICISVGAMAGLTSVILILLLSQPRILMTMANDGLLPPVFARLHPRFKTPFYPTLLCGSLCVVLSGFLPVDFLGDMTSVGTLLAFFTVNVGVIVLRYTDPHRKRIFKVPFGQYVFPPLGAIISITLIGFSGADTIYRLLGWLGLGLIIYFCYGFRHSKIGDEDNVEDYYAEQENKNEFSSS
ncbi:putative amino acid permease YfnA [Zancudomyces culisetae]|uniref:Putative amino acid permease YfnA n=1 Tax=Zancudomyces culisetae TaxID=1213189 RepID=A0A1R1PVB4_ZANCU|nr:putative amino acid permease YfnA [Zancudomyces culisetae]|eukprot:OMH84917.1 putative amino acid permease YfnA [Zancudomyces culisetae]